jgi:hypothetical protein
MKGLSPMEKSKKTYASAEAFPGRASKSDSYFYSEWPLDAVPSQFRHLLHKDQRYDLAVLSCGSIQLTRNRDGQVAFSARDLETRGVMILETRASALVEDLGPAEYGLSRTEGLVFKQSGKLRLKQPQLGDRVKLQKRLKAVGE